MLSRTLSGLILALALLCGAVLFFDVRSGGQVAVTQPPVGGTQLPQRQESFLSGILSKLSLFPGSRLPAPFAVMIENHEDARPHHAGISEALMVQEFLVEGFISRFVAVFDAYSLPVEIGPVRSLRPYFLDGIRPWSQTVIHAGGSPEALDRVRNSDEFYALNLLHFDEKDRALRRDSVAAPHNLFLQKEFLHALLQGTPGSFLRQMQWPPYPVGNPRGGDPVRTLRLNFFNPLHNVSFEYMPLAEKYRRINGGIVSPARPSTIIILEAPIDSIGEHGRLSMTLTGGGVAQVYHSGKFWEGRWSRQSVTEPYAIRDASGEDIPIARGQIWMTVLPTLERVSVE